MKVSIDVTGIGILIVIVRKFGRDTEVLWCTLGVKCVGTDKGPKYCPFDIKKILLSQLLLFNPLLT